MGHKKIFPLPEGNTIQQKVNKNYRGIHTNKKTEYKMTKTHTLTLWSVARHFWVQAPILVNLYM